MASALKRNFCAAARPGDGQFSPTARKFLKVMLACISQNRFMECSQLESWAKYAFAYLELWPLWLDRALLGSRGEKNLPRRGFRHC
jgi:hypothetical protein